MFYLGLSVAVFVPTVIACLCACGLRCDRRRPRLGRASHRPSLVLLYPLKLLLKNMYLVGTSTVVVVVVVVVVFVFVVFVFVVFCFCCYCCCCCCCFLLSLLLLVLLLLLLR